MADAIGPAIKAALADQIRDALVPVLGADLQVEPRYVLRPTPPTIDVFPAAQNAIAFGPAEVEMPFTVRARIGTPDADAAQDILDELVDPVGDGSVALAIAADLTLSGACEPGPPEPGAPPARSGSTRGPAAPARAPS